MAFSPAFQLYPNDWLSSTAITLMSPSEEGAYIRLLCYAWNDPDCSLPNDDEALRALSRLTPDRGDIAKVKKCFIAHPEKADRLINEKLFKVRIEQEEWRQHQSEAGKKGANSRWNKGKKKHGKPNRVATKTPMAKNGPSSSSSSSPISSSSSLPSKEEESADEKIKYADFVTLSSSEYQALVDEHGEAMTKRMIETLSNYKGAHGKRYKSDYRAILSWVVDKVKGAANGTHSGNTGAGPAKTGGIVGAPDKYDGF